MSTLSRRTFVKGVAAMPLSLWLARNASAANPLVRYDAASADGLAMLQVYANTVQQMQALGPDNPLSWMWQWYTHFVDGSTTKSAEITRIFGPSPTTQSALANEVWNTCQSHSGQNSNYFLPWHRMFVLFFESIVRQVSGVPSFTLPYWNYTSSDPALRGIVPPQFRMPTDPVFSPLYRPDRGSLANSGQRIDKYQTYDVMDISAAMATANYSTVDTVQGFCRSIDNGIHGRIHVLTGTTKDMGAVPYAARDPLFWTHHISIDRMWASWNLNGGVNPATATWATKTFVFVDANGQRVTGRILDYFDIAPLGYTYDNFIPPAGTTGATTTAKAATALAPTGVTSQRVAATRNGVNLGAVPVHAPLLPVQTTRSGPVLGLDARHPAQRTYLVVKDLHTWAQPGVLYHLYLNPGQGRAKLDPDHYVGNINFFDAQFHDHGNSALDMALGENFYSFDVTDLLRRLERAGGAAARDALLVSIAPGGRPEGGSPLIGTIELRRR
ncbi:MAG: tyrosinase family protein [Lysobacter sp.]|nr:tyrosinase family protein [Lysobacter sp.]